MIRTMGFPSFKKRQLCCKRCQLAYKKIRISGCMWRSHRVRAAHVPTHCNRSVRYCPALLSLLSARGVQIRRYEVSCARGHCAALIAIAVCGTSPMRSACPGRAARPPRSCRATQFTNVRLPVSQCYCQCILYSIERLSPHLQLTGRTAGKCK